MKLLAINLLIFTAGIALAASSYKYECPKCHLIKEYGVPGIYKCASDGWTMIPKLGK